MNRPAQKPTGDAVVVNDFDALFTAWHGTVLDWCRRLGGPRVDAEDAAHDVFLVVMARMATLRDPDRIGAWMFGSTRRVLAGHRRQAWVRRWNPWAERDPVDPRASARSA